MKPNIILVLLDGARYDRLNKSNTFMELVNKGTLLSNVTTAAPYTFASINAIFTGLFGKENGVDAYYKMFKLKETVDFLPETLQKNGYFTSCDLISDKVISSRGFDIYQSHNEYEDDLKKRHPDLLKRTFESANGKPVFIFLQFSRIHTVTVSEILKKYEWNNKRFYEKKEQNLKTYDKVFSEAGIYANTIYDELMKINKLENTILVFFSDHGTGVGERFGERNYGVYLHEETVRTFYLFLGTDIKQNQNDNLLSTIDIYPTILNLCDIELKRVPGKSFAQYLRGIEKSLDERQYVYSETGGLQGPHPSPYQPNVFCIKTPHYKLIFHKTANEWNLFDLHKDAQEMNNLYGQNLEIENELTQKLLDWINR